jgi:DHA1 family inner membrane transport protein
MTIVAPAAWRVPVAGLFVAAFAVCTSELIIAGLLPALAAEFAVDIPTAGLLITGYALGVAIAGPILALLTRGVPRKLLLLLVMGVFVVGSVLCAVSTTYLMLLSARIVVACCHGLFFGLAMVMATRLAPENRQTTAVSLVIAGVTLSNIAGIPIGTALGNEFGWRTTFWLIAAAGAVAAVGVWALIPAERVQQQRYSSTAMELSAAARPAVLFCYLVTALFMAGTFSLFTYIVPLLTSVSGVPDDLVPWVLFGMGFTGFFGNLIGGRLGDWKPTITMIGILAVATILFAVMTTVSGSAWGMAIALWVGWFVGFGFPAPVRARILRETRDAPTFAATLTSTAFNIGIAAGAALGGAALASGWSFGQLPWIGVGCFSLSLIGTLMLAAFDRRTKTILAASA